jgi:hypothetical protein
VDEEDVQMLVRINLEQGEFRAAVERPRYNPRVTYCLTASTVRSTSVCRL